MHFKFGHTADCHISTKHFNDSLESLEFICKKSINENCEFLIIAGDFWDHKIMVSKKSPLIKSVNLLRDLAKKIPIIMI